MTTRVVFVGERGKIYDLALQLQAILSGRTSDKHQIARGFMLAVGNAALHDIHQAYLVKAAGGTDEMGIKWPPLSPKTIAQRRVGPRDVRKNPEIKERKKIVDREYRKNLRRLKMSLPESQAKRRARQLAERTATRETGKTKFDTLGTRRVEILRDTGVLLNSLGPGELFVSGTTPIYNKPSGEGGDQQVMEPLPGSIIVGTNVRYADYHQSREPRTRLPRRQFLPDDEQQIPTQWWDNWTDAGALALEASAAMLFEENSG